MPRSSMRTTSPNSPRSHASGWKTGCTLGSRLLSLAVFIWATSAQAQAPRDFHACQLFTLEDATAVLGGPAEPEPTKAKAPKTSLQCNYLRQDGAKAMAASASFRFFRSPAEALATLKESRLEARGRPLIISGQDAYWHPKTAQLFVAKGNSLVMLQVGVLEEKERDPEPARKAAERLLPRMGG